MSRHRHETIGTTPVARTVSDLRRYVDTWHKAGETVALVPTMGALHLGHLALVERASRTCTRTVVSLFVNPTQFGPGEDFGSYPRDEAGDAAKLEAAHCDLLFAPSLAEMYPNGHATTVVPGAIAAGQCGRFRPGHFAGVATVVTKLLLHSQADAACFGEKDYQQLQVVRQVVRDLGIRTRIEGVPTVREPDGLALSSRNIYLTPEQRSAAPSLFRVLTRMSERLENGETTAARAIADGLGEFAGAGFSRIDYLEICDAETLAPLDTIDRPGRILAAIWLDRTRLIDNVAVNPRRGAGP